MTTPGAQASFLKWLDEQIELAKADAAAALHHEPNSYCHGLRNGERNALLDVKAYFTGDYE